MMNLKSIAVCTLAVLRLEIIKIQRIADRVRRRAQKGCGLSVPLKRSAARAVITRLTPYAFTLSVVFFALCSRKWDNPYGQEDYNTLPKAAFTITRVPGVDATTFVFDASGCSDIEDVPAELQVRWDWESDGDWDTEFSTVKTDTHTFAASDVKRVVRMEVRDTDNGVTAGSKTLGVMFTVSTWLNSFVFYVQADASPIAFAAGDKVRWDSDDDGIWDADWDTVLTDTFAYASEDDYVIRLQVKYPDGTVEEVATGITALFRPGMKPVPGGTFMMGSEFDDAPDKPSFGTFADEKPVHSITVSSFWMDSTEVTQADYLALMGVNPSYQADRAGNPVEQVSWYDAVLYCNARSVRDGLDTVYSYGGRTSADGMHWTLTGVSADFTANGYRLPTEAQWEYACRAGSGTRYCYGDSTDRLADYAWYADNSPNHSSAVAGKLPNAFGLYDLHGNVVEWCYDRYDSAYYGYSPLTDPAGPAADTFLLCITRGGSFKSGDAYLRSAQRSSMSRDSASDLLGFRVVLP